MKKTNGKISFELVTSICLLAMWVLTDMNLMILAIAILIIPILLFPNNYHIKVGSLQKCYLGLIVYGAFITFVFIGVNYNVRTSVNQIIKYFIIFFECLFLGSRMDSSRFFSYLRNIGVVLSVLACIEGLVKSPFLHIMISGGMMREAPGLRIISIFHTPIMCGGFLCLFLLLLIFYPFKNKGFTYICIFISALAVILNKSRSSWIAFALILALWYFKKNNMSIKKTLRDFFLFKKKRLYLFFAITVFFLIGFAFGNNLLGNLISIIAARFSGSLEAGEGNIIRIETVINSFKYWRNGHILDAIFGHGKNFDKIFLAAYPVIKGNGSFVWDGCIDNQYITWIHEFGLIGLTLMTFVIVIAFRRIKASAEGSRELIFSNLFIIFFMITTYFYESFNYQLMTILFNLFLAVSDKTWVHKE